MIEFKPWPKTPRLFRDITITEKIDGTNAAVQIHEFHFGEHVDGIPPNAAFVLGPGDDADGLPKHEYLVLAQSRKRVITPEDDNAGFARWVYDNAETLVKDLGPGTHFGEWWGAGIQRRYGMDHKQFSLFNTAKWSEFEFTTPNLSVVPVLYQGPFSEDTIHQTLADLRQFGSFATAGEFDDPEGIVIYHQAANQVFKVLLEGDELPKSLVNA